jgi:hypothetical protein
VEQRTNAKMLVMMDSFGFSIQDCSPFSMQFNQADDLQKVFISYLSQTFAFDGIKGSHNDDNEAVAQVLGRSSLSIHPSHTIFSVP